MADILITGEHSHESQPVTVEQLERMALLARDLEDPEFMADAWA